MHGSPGGPVTYAVAAIIQITLIMSVQCMYEFSDRGCLRNLRRYNRYVHKCTYHIGNRPRPHHRFLTSFYFAEMATDVSLIGQEGSDLVQSSPSPKAALFDIERAI